MQDGRLVTALRFPRPLSAEIRSSPVLFRRFVSMVAGALALADSVARRAGTLSRYPIFTGKRDVLANAGAKASTPEGTPFL